MNQAQALVDYEKFRSAKVVLFVDTTDVARSYEMIDRHREAIDRICRLFSARVLLVEGAKLVPEMIVEDEFADAWILLVSEGRNRAMSTRKNPQRINVTGQTDWEFYAFKEILRQIKESTRIIEDVTKVYSRFSLGERKFSGNLLRTSPN